MRKKRVGKGKSSLRRDSDQRKSITIDGVCHERVT